jgi:hypothetical protein
LSVPVRRVDRSGRLTQQDGQAGAQSVVVGPGANGDEQGGAARPVPVPADRVNLGTGTRNPPYTNAQLAYRSARLAYRDARLAISAGSA